VPSKNGPAQRSRQPVSSCRRRSNIDRSSRKAQRFAFGIATGRSNQPPSGSNAGRPLPCGLVFTVLVEGRCGHPRLPPTGRIPTSTTGARAGKTAAPAARGRCRLGVAAGFGGVAQWPPERAAAPGRAVRARPPCLSRHMSCRDRIGPPSSLSPFYVCRPSSILRARRSGGEHEPRGCVNANATSFIHGITSFMPGGRPDIRLIGLASYSRVFGHDGGEVA